RRAEHRHETITQKLVDDAVVPVHDLDHELKQRLQILDYFLRTSLLRKAGEVTDIEKHHTHILTLAAEIRFQVHQLAHDFRRDIFTERARDAVALLDYRKSVENAFADLDRDEPGDNAHHEQKKTLEQVLWERDKYGIDRRASSLLQEVNGQYRILQSGYRASKYAEPDIQAQCR